MADGNNKSSSGPGSLPWVGAAALSGTHVFSSTGPVYTPINSASSLATPTIDPEFATEVGTHEPHYQHHHSHLVLNTIEEDLSHPAPLYEGGSVNAWLASAQHVDQGDDKWTRKRKRAREWWVRMREEWTWRRVIKAVLEPSNLGLLSLLVFTTGMNVTFKKVSIMLAGYPYLLAQLQPAMCGALYLLLGVALVVYNLDSTPPNTTTSSNSDNSRQMRVLAVNRMYRRLLWPAALTGALFQAFLFLLRVGNSGDRVPGPVSVLISQLSVPTIIVVSFIFLRTRYKFWQYLGALIIMAGVVVTLWPYFSDLQNAGTVWALIILVSANLPMALALAVMEYFVKAEPVNDLVWWGMVYIVGGAICLVNSVNERDLNLLNSRIGPSVESQ
eukprot:TRINITY_DN1590_c0_g1_i4.p1 TRINITY_DN1590_c0_g1~~TRINITY_DN1590_c0_g1_i4.p1  ORF type:complete len:386 (+),score=56.13 TRINITY_DN1590_c0_g1_i4:257-1414(+)